MNIGYNMKNHLMKLALVVAFLIYCTTAIASVGKSSLAKELVKGKADSLSITNTSIAFGKSVLLHDMKIRIAALDSTAVPELDFGMFNVSVEGEGYRFLPHGTHFDGEGATVRLKYDRTRIPSGYTEDDIRTYYYDTNKKCWVVLPRVEVDKQSACVVSKTTHFTDMINGVIVAPESPETDTFAPTMMNDIKAADPTSKINIIMPPTANNRGSANLTYPFEMPPARNGMQPQVALSYSSDGGSGWAGEGWDISIPTISIDTRWGVPRYNPEFETETYLLNGQMLAMMNGDEMTVAHRQDSIPRDTVRQFFLRQGGDFSKIVRYGKNPSNYYWEITDRNGVVYTYGGSNNSVLRGLYKGLSGGQREVIAEWKLSNIRETHGDSIAYEYEDTTETVLGGFKTHPIYLNKIHVYQLMIDSTYLETSTVVFHPYKENGDTILKSVQHNNARYGFLSSSNRLLGSVEVKFMGDKLRQYDLEYNIDTTFHIDQLKKITHLDNNNQVVSYQIFDYYDDVKGQQSYYSAYRSDSERWGFNDTTHCAAFSGVIPVGHASHPTALGGTYSKTDAVSLYAGVGFGFTSGKSLTAGVSTGFSLSESEGKSVLIDINGDGLLDIVYKDSLELKYFPQIISDDSIKFGPSCSIITNGLISDFSLNKTTTYSGGVKAYAGVGPAFAEGGVDVASSKTKTTHYFADVNSDGLVDIVANGQVYFNHIDNDGTPNFTLSSAVTPSPINNQGEVDITCMADLSDPIDTLIKYSPMQDVVRVWEAPYDGKFRIISSVNYIIPEDTTNKDGVRVAIQFGDKDIERWQQVIGKDDSNIYVFELDTLLSKGACVFFRTQCGNDSASNGESDKVKWNICIKDSLHLNETVIDPDGYNYYVFSSTDPIPSSSVGQFPVNGPVAISGTFNKPVTTDSVRVNILYRYIEHFVTPNLEDSCAYSDPPELIYTHTYPCDTLYLDFNPQIPDTCNNGLLIFEMSSESNIAWEKVEWNPIVQQDTVSFIVRPAVKRFNKSVLKGDPFVASNGFNDYDYWRDIQVDNNYSGYLLQTIKSENGLIAKDTVYINNGSADNNQATRIHLNSGERIWFDYYTDNETLANNIQTAKIQISHPYFSDPGDENNDPLEGPPSGIPVVNVNASVYTIVQDSIIGTNLRGWGQFVYNAFNDRYNHPIVLNTLALPSDSTECDPLNMSISLLAPKTEDPTYLVGAKPEIFIHGDTVGVARLRENNVIPTSLFGQMVDEIDDPIGERLKGTTARGLTLVSKSNSKDLMASAGIAMFSATLNQSNGSSTAQNAFMDMNGDGYPDIVTKKSIQYTNTHGGFAGGGTLYREDQSFDSIEMEMTTLNKANSVGFGGNYVHSFSTSKRGGTAEVSRENAQAAASISGNINVNCDSVRYSYVDINGDGLPDMLSVRDDQVTKARLNLGYHFSDDFTLQTSTPEIQSSVAKSCSASLGGSFNIDAASFSGGFGISTTTSRDSTSFFDINGDGLPDKVTITNDNDINVQLNLGNRFQTEIWKGVDKISENSSTSKSENVSFTINFYPFGGKIAITPGYNNSKGMSRPNYELRDIDGDGFLDVLESKYESDLRVRYSTIARTNKLKTVTNSLGGSFIIDYEHSTPTYGLPGGKWVMSMVEVNYGLDSTDYYIPHSKTAFEYNGGRRDRHEREFLGFAEVISKQLNTEGQDTLYRKTVELYDTASIYTTGNLIGNYVQDYSGVEFTEVHNDYYLYGITNDPSDFNGGKYKFNAFFNAWNDRGAAYTPLRYTVNKQKGQILSEEWNKYYDDEGDHGLLHYYKYSDKGSLGEYGCGEYDYKTTVNYTCNLSDNNYIFGLPFHVTVSDDNQCFHDVRAVYDTNYPNHITQIFRRVSNSELSGSDGYEGGSNNVIIPPGIIFPDSEENPLMIPSYPSGDCAITSFYYDTFGNIDSVSLPRGCDNKPIWYKYHYDETLNTYLAGVNDVFDLSSTIGGFDYRYGISNHREDQNGVHYHTTTDNLGRLSTVTSPNEIDQSLPTITFEYHPIASYDNDGRMISPAYAVTTYNFRRYYYERSQRYTDVKSMKVTTFVDGFGRVIETRKESYIHNH